MTVVVVSKDKSRVEDFLQNLVRKGCPYVGVKKIFCYYSGGQYGDFMKYKFELILRREMDVVINEDDLSRLAWITGRVDRDGILVVLLDEDKSCISLLTDAVSPIYLASEEEFWSGTNFKL